MLITEYRIPLPLTVKEYRIGQLYTTMEMSKDETGGGEGVEVLENRPFEDTPLLGNTFKEGQYTHKIYHLANKVPKYLRYLTPAGSLQFEEKAWNSFPYCSTEITNPSFMKENFTLIVKSHHFDDDIGEQENVHQLAPQELQQRTVEFIDIANDPIRPSLYNEEYDPSLYKSTYTQRGHLKGDWIRTTKPIMTCYKLVYSEFKWLGLQGRVEKFIQSTERRIFFLFHRMLFCGMDSWYSIPLNHIRDLEKQNALELQRRRREDALRGYTETS
ncbi:phosphatidylinositol transfer protein alpha isoform isoform X1 [Nilaparvata lugens]|uniref:phosphatidylinositol transfer protein alpha isoform isoform X1 n=1 Tax=Nilaparvata lugens TaxID=108931 RepID=UPI00193CA845|nr:phosphatidylinositol transfer protein alpha isoform isoform X1 [Nilaparvata lugens]